MPNPYPKNTKQKELAVGPPKWLFTGRGPVVSSSWDIKVEEPGALVLTILSMGTFCLSSTSPNLRTDVSKRRHHWNAQVHDVLQLVENFMAQEFDAFQSHLRASQ